MTQRNLTKHRNIGTSMRPFFGAIAALAMITGCSVEESGEEAGNNTDAISTGGNPDGTRWNGSGYTKCLDERTYSDGTPYVRKYNGALACVRRYPRSWSLAKQNAFDDTVGYAILGGFDAPADGVYDLERAQSKTCVPFRTANFVEPLIYKEYRFRNTSVEGYGSSRVLVGWKQAAFKREIAYVFVTDNHYTDLVRVLGDLSLNRGVVEDYVTGKKIVGGTCSPPRPGGVAFSPGGSVGTASAEIEGP
jgi:hypothetical protein